MSLWSRLFRRRKRMMEDLEQDIRDFIERETQDNIERGTPPEEARYAALRKLPGLAPLPIQGCPGKIRGRVYPTLVEASRYAGKASRPPTAVSCSQSAGIKRIEEFQAGKTCEVAVGGGQDGAMLDGQRGQVGVRNQRSACLSFGHHLAQYPPMPFAGIEQGNCRVFKPAGDDCRGFVQGRRVSAKAWVCTHAQKSKHRRPSQPYRLVPGKGIFEPAAGRRMMGRTGIVSVEEEIGIDDNHRW